MDTKKRTDDLIKEIRRRSRLSQREFAKLYDIPLSTLRKWEQNESNPPEYVVNLILRLIKPTEGELKIIEGKRRTYYYDKLRNMVFDGEGNGIKVKDNLDEINQHNLKVYLNELFDDYYKALHRFEEDCKYDKIENIIWEEK